jgi:membrane-associated phospholipid phosphatase
MNDSKQKINQIFEQYKHLLLLLYFPIYLLWFAYVEKTVTTEFNVIHMKIDDYIPFCEYFIVPYVLWYGYVAVVMIYMMLKDKSDIKKMCVFLYVGMTIFLIISTVYPNGHLLRPTNYERDNIFTQLCTILHRVDTATNIFPSIHVYDSIGVHLAIVYNEKMKKNKWLCIASTILMVSIVLSTVFLKQHSVWDVISAAVLAFIMQQIVYVRPWKRITQRKRTKVKSIKC